jgi:hypothetical protein
MYSSKESVFLNSLLSDLLLNFTGAVTFLDELIDTFVVYLTKLLVVPNVAYRLASNGMITNEVDSI